MVAIFIDLRLAEALASQPGKSTVTGTIPP